MRKSTLEITVGLFVITGLAALLVLAIKVSGLTDIYSGDTGYEVTADFTNIGGLKPRARVSLAGVPVGRVIAIDLDKENFVAHVTMIIREDMHSIPADSQASILTAGLLGDNYIGLTPGFSDRMLSEGGHIAVEDTSSAVILEQLISKFVSGKASE